jgi:UDP:flavonoid glycosyltransferase YjiC (YdhE family)
VAERVRILFFGEPVTAAHVVRPLELARGLDAARFDVALATAGSYARYAEQAGVATRPLWSVGSERFLAAVAAGKPVFGVADLERAIADDLAHIEAYAPAAVVGDFRLSLAVSARLAGVPYLAIGNAYWSPHARARFQIPVHPLSRLLGPGVATRLFRAARPLVFAQHALPMHRVRRRHRLASLGFDLRRVFTESDLTLFADARELVPVAPSPDDARTRFVGALHWSPPAALPAALLDADDRPLAYIALGSSGDPALVRGVAEAAAALGCRVAVATSGRLDPAALPAGSIVAPFMPGSAVARRAALVVCNGGSPAVQQALVEGVPVLGLPANLDQLLNMHFTVRARAGLALRPERATAPRVHEACARLLHDADLRAGARAAAAVYARYDAHRAFGDALDGLIGTHGAGRRIHG